MPLLTESPAWRALVDHREALADTSIRTLFDRDAERASRFSLAAAGLFVDYSKNAIVDDTVARLVNLARQAGVDVHRDAMFAGEHINRTENRAVLHIALRDRSGAPRIVDGVDVSPLVADVLARTRRFSGDVRPVRGAATRGVRLLMS